MNTSKGISSILIVGLVLALAAGLFGLWYLNKLESNKIVVVNQEVSQEMPVEVEVTPTPTPVVDLNVKSISTDPTTTEADLDTLETQMGNLDGSLDVNELDDLN